MYANFTDYELSVGDYADYIKAIEDLELARKFALRNPSAARAMRHKANETLRALEARYHV